jgi:NADPH-dependent curcumin reductase
MPIAVAHQCVRLIKRPVGEATREHFKLELNPTQPLQKGYVRVAVGSISIDPAMRVWMSDLPSYVPPVAIGEVMRAYGVGEVTESNHANWPCGSHVTGMLGVQNEYVGSPKSLKRVDCERFSLSAHLGPLGIPGLTAYFGLFRVAKLKKSDTLLVSAAAGAVGSMVGQIAKHKGCRVVGLSGDPIKCKHLLDDLGFDAAIDYKVGPIYSQIKEACPQGVDVYFDNVGAKILDAALGNINQGARIVLCGAISGYNATRKPVGPANYLALLQHRARMEGFIVTDYIDEFDDAIEELKSWMDDGVITYRETFVDGLESFHTALERLFHGDKLGKLCLRP